MHSNKQGLKYHLKESATVRRRLTEMISKRYFDYTAWVRVNNAIKELENFEGLIRERINEIEKNNFQE